MAQNLKIYVTFDDNRRVFFPGLPITGKVHVNVKEGKGSSYQNISLKLSGFAFVHFRTQENSSDGKSNINKHHKSRELYYDINMNLWNKKNLGAEQNTLNPGNHNFPFSIVLPTNVPSSFESKIGHVRHLCKATLAVSSKFKKNSNYMMPFSIASISDLNAMPLAVKPIVANEQKFLGYLCCKSGPLSIALNIGRTGYVSGESIIINAECSNNSNNTMKCTKLELFQCLDFKAQDMIRREIRIVLSKVFPSITARGNQVLTGEKVPIPPLPPSGLPGCSIINVSYLLRFSMVPNGLGLSLKVENPILLGTIPLVTTFNQFVSGQQQTTSSGIHSASFVDDNPPPYVEIPSAPIMNFPGLEIYPDLPPPSYNECKFGEVDFSYGSDDEDAGSQPSAPFAPQYISYNLNQN